MAFPPKKKAAPFEKKEPKGEERKESKMAPRARKKVEQQEMSGRMPMMFGCGGRVKKK